MLVVFSIWLWGTSVVLCHLFDITFHYSGYSVRSPLIVGVTCNYRHLLLGLGQMGFSSLNENWLAGEAGVGWVWLGLGEVVVWGFLVLVFRKRRRRGVHILNLKCNFNISQAIQNSYCESLFRSCWTNISFLMLPMQKAKCST